MVVLSLLGWGCVLLLLYWWVFLFAFVCFVDALRVGLVAGVLSFVFGLRSFGLVLGVCCFVDSVAVCFWGLGVAVNFGGLGYFWWFCLWCFYLGGLLWYCLVCFAVWFLLVFYVFVSVVDCGYWFLVDFGGLFVVALVSCGGFGGFVTCKLGYVAGWVLFWLGFLAVSV